MSDHAGPEATSPLPNDITKKENFIVQVQFCRNASWQGTLTWIDKKKSRCFRSTLELIKLMDSAISIDHGEGEEKDW